MKRRRLRYVAVIAVLVAANVWHWLPRANRMLALAPIRAETLRPEDFRIYAAPPLARAVAHRDLFGPRRVSAPAIPHALRKVAAPAAATPQQQGHDAAQDDLARIKVLGIVIHDGKARAYLSEAGRTYIAHVGDSVSGHFTVTQIAVDSIELNDVNTNIRGRIPVSGK